MRGFARQLDDLHRVVEQRAIDADLVDALLDRGDLLDLDDRRQLPQGLPAAFAGDDGALLCGFG